MNRQNDHDPPLQVAPRPKSASSVVTFTLRAIGPYCKSNNRSGPTCRPTPQPTTPRRADVSRRRRQRTYARVSARSVGPPAGPRVVCFLPLHRVSFSVDRRRRRRGLAAISQKRVSVKKGCLELAFGRSCVRSVAGTSTDVGEHTRGFGNCVRVLLPFLWLGR